MIPVIGILASVPKLLLIINKIRAAISKLGPQIARIISDLSTTIAHLLSRWPEKTDGGLTNQIHGILTQLKEALQDAASRFRRSSPRNKQPDSSEPNGDVAAAEGGGGL